MTILPIDDVPFPFKREGHVFSPGRMLRLLLPGIAGVLAVVQWFLPQQALKFDLACIIALGLPHGALDVEIARQRLVGFLPRLWFPVFAIPYLMLALVVLALWQVAPYTTLCLFLAMSVWHFGETPGAPWWQRLMRGGAPIALPVLLQPALTAALLAGIAQVSIPVCPAWLLAASVAWLGLTIMALAFRAVPMTVLRELALLGVLYAALPPLTALAIYFVCLHAPAHMCEVIDRRLSLRVVTMTAAWRYALPPTLLTLVIGGRVVAVLSRRSAGPAAGADPAGSRRPDPAAHADGSHGVAFQGENRSLICYSAGMTLQAERSITPEEYLAAEECAEYKSEFYDGEVFAMVGATSAHVTIAMNLGGSLYGQLKGKYCRGYGADMQVRVSPTKYFYPDLSIVCGKPEFLDATERSLLNPQVIFEILSESTERFDRGLKFHAYAAMESLTDYVLVEQDKPRMEHFTRQPSGDWLLHVASGAGSGLRNRLNQLQGRSCRCLRPRRAQAHPLRSHLPGRRTRPSFTCITLD